MTSPEIPGFRLIGLLRESSNLSTWKAVQTSLDRTVWLKILHPEARMTDAEVRHFVEIARAVARVRHAGVAQIYDVVADVSQPYVVMEHVEGETLAEGVTAKGPMAPAQAARVARQIAEALDCAWSQVRLVVRNLKPHEVRLTPQGQAKLVDFGLAVQVQEGVDPTALDGGLVVGTPQFISPEQARLSSSLDCRADMYALGATLYFLLTGRVPFGDQDPAAIINQQVEGQIPHPRDIDNRIPGTLCSVVSRLMMKSPDDRYAAWQDVIHDLDAVLRNKPLPRRPHAGGRSTIAACRDGGGRSPRLTTPGRADAPAAAQRRAPGPATGLQVILWLLLGGWFLWLANWRMGNPAGLPSGGTWPVGSGEQFEAAARPDTPPRLPAPPPVAPRIVQEETSPAYVPGGPGEASGATPEPAPAAGGLPAALLTELGRALAAGNFTAARLALSGPVEGIDPTRLDALRKAVEALPDPDSQVEAGLMAKRGQVVRITYLERERSIVPIAVANGQIQAEFVSDDGTRRPVSFSTAKFAPAEKLRWLPPAATPADHAVACVLALQAGERAALQLHLPQAGSLRPALEAAANAPTAP